MDLIQKCFTGFETLEFKISGKNSCALKEGFRRDSHICIECLLKAPKGCYYVSFFSWCTFYHAPVFFMQAVTPNIRSAKVEYYSNKGYAWSKNEANFF